MFNHAATWPVTCCKRLQRNNYVLIPRYKIRVFVAASVAASINYYRSLPWKLFVQNIHPHTAHLIVGLHTETNMHVLKDALCAITSLKSYQSNGLNSCLFGAGVIHYFNNNNNKKTWAPTAADYLCQSAADQTGAALTSTKLFRAHVKFSKLPIRLCVSHIKPHDDVSHTSLRFFIHKGREKHSYKNR